MLVATSVVATEAVQDVLPGVEPSTQHDPDDPAAVANLRSGVSVHDDEVSQLSDLDRAEPVLHTEAAGRIERRCPYRLEGRDATLNHCHTAICGKVEGLRKMSHP